MKKILLMMAFAALGAVSCSERPAPLAIDNALTAEEIAEGRLTPEVMWKMSRSGQSSLSPDGTQLLYAQTDYNMAENRGSTTLWIEEVATKAVRQLTDRNSQNTAPQWSADGEKIYRMREFFGQTHYSYVPDPYYEGHEGFEIVLDLLEEACERLLEELTAQA